MVLVAGFRRLAACKLLGWGKIPARVLSAKEVESSKVEIAENLHRQELTALERAEHVAAWKAIYLAGHPEAGHGKAPGAGRGKKKAPKEPNLGSLGDAGEAATGRKRSSNQRDFQIAENIPQEVRDAIRVTGVALLRRKHYHA